MRNWNKKKKPNVRKILGAELQKYAMAFAVEFQDCVPPADWKDPAGKKAKKQAVDAIMKAVEEHYDLIVLPKKSYEALQEMLKNPPKPNERLRKFLSERFSTEKDTTGEMPNG